MFEGREHDILKYVGMPLMIGGSVICYKTDGTTCIVAGLVGMVGGTMELSWLAVEALQSSNKRKNN